jgi:FMN reductase (NADPH)
MIPDPRLEVFANHRTVRKFKPVPLEPGHLEQIIWAAQRAPTDATAQMYSFVRLTDPALREEIARVSNNPHMAAASETFIVLADVHRLKKILELRGYEFGNWSDAVMAAQNMLVAAEMLGYQGCWIGGILGALERLVEVLELPEGVLPFAGLTIGVPDETPPVRPRVQTELVLHENKYHKPTESELETALERMAPITARGDWAQTLSRYFAVGGTMETREITLRKVMATQGFTHVSSDLNALFTRTLEAGYAELLIRNVAGEYQAWVDRPDRAHGGTGSSPYEALLNAIAEAEKDKATSNH